MKETYKTCTQKVEIKAKNNLQIFEFRTQKQNEEFRKRRVYKKITLKTILNAYIKQFKSRFSKTENK